VNEIIARARAQGSRIETTIDNNDNNNNNNTNNAINTAARGIPTITFLLYKHTKLTLSLSLCC
jgi:hypothetical protein